MNQPTLNDARSALEAMNVPKSQTVVWNARIDGESNRYFRNLANSYGLTRSEFMRRALVEYAERFEAAR